MFDKNTLAQLEAGYQATKPQTKSQGKTPQVSGIKRLAAGLLPTVGGALGAVGGSFLMPVAGTAAGGAAGSALGEALKQRLLGEKTNLKGIAGEAALGAVPGVFKAAGAGVRAIKGAKAAKEASNAERAAQQIAEQQRVARAGRGVVGSAIKSDVNAVGKQAADAQRFNSLAKQNIEKLGQDNATQGLPLANGGGTLVRPGATPSFASEGIELQPVPKVPSVPGRYQELPTASPTAPTSATQATTTAPKTTLLGKLSTNRAKVASGIKTDPGVGGIGRADEAAQTFQRLKITGTPDQQLRKINEVMASHGKQVDDILEKNPIQLDGAAVKSQVAKAISDPLKYAELDLSTPGAQRALDAHLTKYAESKTAKEVNDYVKVINKVAVKAQAKLDRGATLTDKEAAALAAKKAGDEVLSQYPEIAPLKKDMATLFARNGDVTKLSEKSVGVPLLGVKSKSLAQAKAGAQSRVAGVLNTTDQVVNGTVGQNTKKVAGSLLSQMVTRGVAGGAQSPNNTDNTNQTSNIDPSITSTATNIPSLNDGTGETASSSDFFSDPEQVKQAYLQALNKGDSETANSIIKGYELFGGAGAEKPLSAEAAKTVSNAQTGIQALNDFNALIQQDPGAFNRTNIPGVGALDKLTSGRVSGALGTSGLNAARQQVIDVIARLRTGAAISADEAARFEQFVPQPGDPPEVQQQKTSYLSNQFQLVAKRSGTAGTDLQQTAGAQF